MRTNNYVASRRNLVAFWLLGMLNNFGYVVLLSAAEDLIEGQSGTVLAADVTPGFLIGLTAPWWAHRIPYTTRVVLVSMFGAAGFLCVAFLDSVPGKIAGVCMQSVSSGWGEVTMLSLTSFYSPDSLNMWSSGTGLAGIVGAGWYLVLHQLCKISSRMTLIMAVISPIAYLGIFTFLLKRPQSEQTLLSDEQRLSDTVVDSSVNDWGVDADEKTVLDSQNAAGTKGAASLSISQRFTILSQLKWFMIPMAIVYFAEYVIQSGINSAMSFNDMGHKAFYVAAGFCYQVGVFLSRSSHHYVQFQRLWPFPSAQMFLLLAFTLQAVYMPVKVGWPVLGLVVVVGLWGGATYVNAFQLIRQMYDQPGGHVQAHDVLEDEKGLGSDTLLVKHQVVEMNEPMEGPDGQNSPEDISKASKEFALGAACVANNVGIVLAAVTSMFVECALARHNGIEQSSKHCVY